MIDIIVPVFNESEIIETFLKTLKKELKKQKFRVIIVDDSNDNTFLIANKTCKDLRIKNKIIRRFQRLGKGSAVNTGLKELNSEYTVLIDADLEYHPKYILPMIKMLKDYNLVTSVRIRKDPWYRRILGFFFKKYVQLLFGISFETQSGLKVFRTKDVKGLNLISKGWVYDVELIYKFLKKNLSVGTFKIEYTTRTAGKTKIGFLTPFQMLKDLLVLRFSLKS
ncbi:MAG: glycosyltransferase family 2 protein [Nanoarchaeota archaeon]|nr:glycosyltransferase family 2 protein [Nanoarchaeota archaeon]